MAGRGSEERRSRGRRDCQVAVPLLRRFRYRLDLPRHNEGIRTYRDQSMPSPAGGPTDTGAPTPRPAAQASGTLEKGSQLPGGRAVVTVGGCGLERAHAAVGRPLQHEKDQILLSVVVDVLETRTRPGWRFPGVATGVVHRMSALGNEGVEVVAVVAVVGVVGTAGIVGNVGGAAFFGVNAPFGVIMIALFGVNASFGVIMIALFVVVALVGITTVGSVTVRTVPPPGYYVLLDCHPRDTDMLAQPYRTSAAETPVSMLRQARVSGEGPEAVVTKASMAMNAPV